MEFIKFLKDVTPDSVQYIITDMFETIILYDNKVDNATYINLDDDQYLVNLKFDVHKFKADEIGNEVSVQPMAKNYLKL